MSREPGDAHVQQAGSLGPWDVWSILLSCPPRACYWLPAAGLLHQLTAMGATGSPGASELTKSHLVTARHQRETTEPSWRRRCPWRHVGSLPVAEGNKCAQAELHHRCRRAPPPVPKCCTTPEASMQSSSTQWSPCRARPRARSPPRCLCLHSFGPGKCCELRGGPSGLSLGLRLALGSVVARVSSSEINARCLATRLRVSSPADQQAPKTQLPDGGTSGWAGWRPEQVCCLISPAIKAPQGSGQSSPGSVCM